MNTTPLQNNSIRHEHNIDINNNNKETLKIDLLISAIQIKNFNLANLLIQQTEEPIDLSLPGKNNNTCYFYALDEESLPLLKKLCARDPQAMKKKGPEGESLLHRAANKSSITVLRYLVEEQKFSTTEGDNKKRTPLHYAVANDTNQMNVKYLIENGADKNAANIDEVTIIEQACLWGSFKIVKYLHKAQNIPLNNKNYRYTPLASACTPTTRSGDKTELIAYLLKNKANPLAIMRGGLSVIATVVKHETPEALKLFFEAGVGIFDRINSSSIPLLLFISATGSNKFLKHAIEIEKKTIQNKKINKTELNKRFKKVLSIEDSFNALDFLLTNEKKSNVDNIKILCENGFLLTQTSPKKNYTPLHLASILNNPQNFDYILSCNPDINAQTTSGKTPLIMTCKWGFEYEAKKLIEKNAQGNIQDKLGMTALHYACENPKSINLIKLLIEQGCDAQLKNNKGETPLMIAVINQNFNAIGALYNIKREVFYTEQPNNLNILHIALISLNKPLATVKVLVLLLKSDNTLQAMINQPSQPHQLTPIMYAAHKNDLETTKFLIDEGADPYAEDSFGRNILSLAASNGFLEIVKYLFEQKKYAP